MAMERSHASHDQSCSMYSVCVHVFLTLGYTVTRVDYRPPPGGGKIP